jgi:Tol biopolymer transport system component
MIEEYRFVLRSSPDGDYLAFQGERDGNFEIYVVKADGGGLRRLTRDESADNWPTWTR